MIRRVGVRRRATTMTVAELSVIAAAERLAFMFMSPVRLTSTVGCERRFLLLAGVERSNSHHQGRPRASSPVVMDMMPILPISRKNGCFVSLPLESSTGLSGCETMLFTNASPYLTGSNENVCCSPCTPKSLMGGLPT